MNKLVLLCLLLGSSHGWCQTNAPADPQVAAIPKMARWDLVNPAAKPAAAAASDSSPAEVFKSANITRTGDEQKVIISKTGGNEEVWISKGEILINLRGIFSSGLVDGFSPPYLRGGDRFFGTEWIKAANFKENTKYKGRECRYYELEEIREIDRLLATQIKQAGAPQAVRYRAWIDAETLLPLAVSGPEGDFVYIFAAPPATALTLPREFQEKRDRIMREVQRQQQEASVR